MVRDFQQNIFSGKANLLIIIAMHTWYIKDSYCIKNEFVPLACEELLSILISLLHQQIYSNAQACLTSYNFAESTNVFFLMQIYRHNIQGEMHFRIKRRLLIVRSTDRLSDRFSAVVRQRVD